MNPIKLLVSPAGRILRVVAGAVIIVGGLSVVGGVVGAVLALVGLVPLLAGTFDLCVFAPLFGYAISGDRTRAAVKGQ